MQTKNDRGELDGMCLGILTKLSTLIESDMNFNKNIFPLSLFLSFSVYLLNSAFQCQVWDSVAGPTNVFAVEVFIIPT
jgi:hypothetical protein